MKKFFQITIFILLISMISAAAAPYLKVPSGISFGDMTRNSTKTLSVLIENTGNVTLTNIVPGASADSKYNLQFNSTGFNLGINQTKYVNVNITIPVNSETGNLSIGNSYFRSNEYNSSNIPMSVRVTGGLEIVDLDIRLTELERPVFSREDRRSYQRTDIDKDVLNGQEIKFDDDYKVGPGSTLEFDFELENKFSDSDDVDIEDITATVTIKEIDDEDDIEEDSDEIDLEPEENDHIKVPITLPLKLKEGTYDIEILIEGEDSNGLDHKIEWNLEVEVEKERHDIYVESAGFISSRLSCSRSTSFKFNLINIGNRDQENIKVELKNTQLGIDYSEQNIELLEDYEEDENEFSRSVPVSVSKDVKAGVYTVDMIVYIEGKIALVKNSFELTIENCGEVPEDNEEDDNKTQETQKNETSDIIDSNVENDKETNDSNVPILNPVDKDKANETSESMQKLVYTSVFITLFLVIGIAVAGFILFKKK